MTSPMRHDTPILVVGGSRGTGLLIARRLVGDGCPVRVLARDPQRAARRLGPEPEIVRGDLTQAQTLPPSVEGARHIIFTAGCRSGRPVRQATIRRTEYEGMLNMLAAAAGVGFGGRFLYMTSSGVGERSFWTFALNTYKGNTLKWRAGAERAIRESGLAYTIIRTGMLTNSPGGRHGIEVTQRPLPLSPRYRIPRADVATVFVAAMRHPRTARATFEIVSQRGPGAPWLSRFDELQPDGQSSSARRRL